MVLTKLLKEEQSWFINALLPTTVVSFYRSRDVSGRLNARENVNEYLSTRFTEILKANPWLCGRLIRQDKKTDVLLSFSEEIISPLDYISAFTDDKLFELKEWSSIWQYLLPYVPKRGSECLGRDEILCKLTIIRNKMLTELAVMFSLNHTIGDGHTLYYLWKMLDENEVITSMSVDRVHDFGHYVKRDTNIPCSDDAKMTKTLKDFLGMLGRGIGRKMRGKSDPKMYMYKVNSEEIKKQKAEYNTQDFFVSTNDILSSWIFGKGLCEADGMAFVVNMRGRVAELRNNIAGNYELLCPISMSSINSPRDFRERWTRIFAKEMPVDVVFSLNVTTNWATFYHQVELKGYSHRFHIPVFSESALTPTLFGVPLVGETSVLIFKLNRDEVGIMLRVYNDVLSEGYFDKCVMLDGKVSF